MKCILRLLDSNPVTMGDPESLEQWTGHSHLALSNTMCLSPGILQRL